MICVQRIIVRSWFAFSVSVCFIYIKPQDTVVKGSLCTVTINAYNHTPVRMPSEANITFRDLWLVIPICHNPQGDYSDDSDMGGSARRLLSIIN